MSNEVTNSASCQTAVSGSAFSDKELRKMAKKICNGHQHAMRYQNMLNACFRMGKMILEELEKQKYDCDFCKGEGTMWDGEFRDCDACSGTGQADR